MNLKERAGKLKSPALAMALKDAGTPTAAKTLAGITVAYALSPIDLIIKRLPSSAAHLFFVVLKKMTYLKSRTLRQFQNIKGKVMQEP